MATSTSTERDGGSRLRFGKLLAEALKRRGMKQEDLAKALGTTQSSVSGWINGKYEPAATTVFAVERALGVDAGHLSRPLGYLPAERGISPLSVESAIAQSAELDDEEKAALVAMYHVLVNRHVPASDAPKPAPSRQGRLTAAGGRAGPRSVAGSR